MRVLVCGMHRSGTSAFSRLLARGSGMSLLDDPAWAIGPKLPDWRANVQAIHESEVVKAPRLTEVLPELSSSFAFDVVVMLRDPRDVWASIAEKVATGRPTRMLSYERLGISAKGVAGFAQAYVRYCSITTQFLSLDGGERSAHIQPYEEFFGDRVASVEHVARRLGLSFDSAAAGQIAARQLGPAANKAGGIRGPGRWREDLSPDDLACLASAVTAWSEVYDGLRTRT